MFNSKNKSKNPIGWVLDTTFDALLPKKQKPKHTIVKTTAVIAAVSAAAYGLSKKKDTP